MSYNGWTNYETWKLHLEVLEGFTDGDTSPEALRDIAEYVLYQGVDNATAESIIDAFISEVNFDEISAHMKEEQADD